MRFDGLIVVVEGEVEIRVNQNIVRLTAGDLFIVPLLSTVDLTALSDVEMLTYGFKVDKYHYCMNRKLEGLIQYHNEDSNALSVPLKISQSLLTFVSSLRYHIDKVPTCSQLYTNKGFELGVLLATDFDAETLCNLFYPLFRSDLDLVLNVCSGLEQFVTLEDMVEWTQMNKFEFLERFQTVFNKTPEDWLEEQRVHLVRHYATVYPCSAQELMIRFYFCSQDHLESFCKRYYNASVNDFIKKSYQPNLVHLF